MTGKVYVIVKEGLGNQLFQLAYGLWQADGDIDRVVLDTSSYARSNQHGGYVLRQLFGEARLAAVQSDTLNLHQVPRATWVNFNRNSDLFLEDLKPLLGKTTLVAEGWFQHYAYVAPNIERLRSWFRASAIAIDADDQAFFDSHTVVGVHIRLNDYLNPQNRQRYGLVDLKAMNQEISRVVAGVQSQRPVKLVAFSDGQVDGRFDRKYMRSAQPTIDGDIRTLKLISLCDHLICSNSTFGLWAGYLSDRVRTMSLPAKWMRTPNRSAAPLLPPNGQLYANELV